MLAVLDAGIADDLATAESLLKSGLDVNERITVTDPTAGSPLNTTPIHAAASAGKPDLIRLLLRFGANVQAEDSHGRTPIQLAGSPESRQLLMDAMTNFRPAFCAQCGQGITASFCCEPCGRMYCEVCSGMTRQVEHHAGFSSQTIDFSQARCPRCTPLPRPSSSPFGPTAPLSADDAARRVRGLANGMIAVGVVYALLGSISLALNIFILAAQPENAAPYGVLGAAMGVAIGLLALRAGRCMKAFKDYTYCLLTSIAVMVPACCIIGVVVGIWSLVVLSKPEVRALFRP
jgi:hypothetical protein